MQEGLSSFPRNTHRHAHHGNDRKVRRKTSWEALKWEDWHAPVVTGTPMWPRSPDGKGKVIESQASRSDHLGPYILCHIFGLCCTLNIWKSNMAVWRNIPLLFNFFTFVSLCIRMCICVYVDTQLPSHTCGGQKTTCGSWFFLSWAFLGLNLHCRAW